MSEDSPAVILYDENGTPVNVILDGAIWRLAVDAKIVGSPVVDIADAIIGAELYTGLVSATTYYCILDLDNQAGAGPYKHSSAATGLLLYGFGGVIYKTKNADQWNAIFGVILDIDGIEATIHWFQVGSLYAISTDEFLDREKFGPFPVALNMTVVGNQLPQLADGGRRETTTDINTAGTIVDIAGNLVTPAIGDVITRLEIISGSGQAIVHYSAFYTDDQ